MVRGVDAVLICIKFAVLPSRWNTQGFKRKSISRARSGPWPRSRHPERMYTVKGASKQQQKGVPCNSSPSSLRPACWPPSRCSCRRRCWRNGGRSPPSSRCAPTVTSTQWTRSTITAHGAKNDANGSMCQACHGDARAHLKDPMKAKPDSPFKKGGRRRSRRGLPDLPQRQPPPRVLGFGQARAERRGLHQLPQHPRQAAAHRHRRRSRRRSAQRGGHVRQCHQPIRAATLKPSHHPIIEGKVKCSDCHNPHGALTPAMVKRTTINQQCYSCHADKRGPYLFAHPPVEENCLSCHNPHGSVYAKLLNEKAAEPLPGLPRRGAPPRHDLRRCRRVQLHAGGHRRSDQLSGLHGKQPGSLNPA